MAGSPIERQLKRSANAIKTARAGASLGDYESAINRAYYSAFYSAHAALRTLNLTAPKKHGSLVKAVISNLKKPQRIGDCAEHVRTLLERRLAADYTDAGAGLAIASDSIRKAEEFNGAVRKWMARRRGSRQNKDRGG